MKTWKKIGLGTVALASASLLAACGGSASSSSSSAASGKPLSLSQPSEIQTLDQSMVTDAYSMNVIGNTQEGLVRNNNGQPSLALAKSFDVSKDGKTITVKLRDGLKWSNGDKLTANDFVYAWQRGINPKTASQYAYMIEEGNIENATDIASGKKPATDLGIKATDDTTLVITLSQATPYFENILALPVFLPQNQKVVEQYGKQYGTSSDKMVYDGPFYFKKGDSNSWTGSSTTYKVVKNPNYYDAKNVKSPSVTWQVVKQAQTGLSLYKSGKILYTGIGDPAIYPNYKNNPDVKNLPVSENEYIEFNQSGKGTTTPEVAKALKNVHIRKAINLAINRQGLINSVSPANKPATGFTPKGTGEINGQDFSEYAKQSEIKYDASAAKTEWQQGLQELGVKSLAFNFETDSDSPTGKQLADFLSKNLESVLPGLTINEHLVPFQQRLKDATNGNFDLIVTLWGGDYSEPSTFLTLLEPTSGQNDGKVNNAAYNAAMQKASTLPDVLNEKDRYADYKDAEKALADDASVAPLEFYNAPDLVSPKLKGVVWNATGLSVDLKEAYLTK